MGSPFTPSLDGFVVSPLKKVLGTFFREAAAHRFCFYSYLGYEEVGVMAQGDHVAGGLMGP